MKIRKALACFLCVVTAVSTVQMSVRGYSGQPLGRNVAKSRIMEVSNSLADSDYNKPAFMTDGDLSKGYQAACVFESETNKLLDHQTWKLDLGKSYTIDTITLHWEAAAAKKYKVYVANTKDEWIQVGEETAGQKGKKKFEFKASDARYVKIELEERVLGYGYHLYELQVFTVGSVEEKMPENLAKNATATASAYDGVAEHLPQSAIDGNMETMWRTDIAEAAAKAIEDKADENLTLHWNSPQTFDTIRIKWGGGYMTGYKFQTSEDGENWEDIYTVTNGKSAEYRNIRLDSTVTTSYLRLQGVTFGAYCFEVYEVEVYDQTNIPVEKINLNYSDLKLNIDSTENNQVELEYNLAPLNTSQTEVVWSSANENIAEVNNGLVTGKSVGRTVITVTSKDNPAIQETCNVSVSRELDKANVTAVRKDKSISISWNNVNRAKSYLLTRTNKSTGIVNKVYEGTATSYEDKDLISGIYVYTVTAIVDENAADSDLYSDSVSNDSADVLIPEDVTGIEVLNDYQHVSMFIGGRENIEYTVLPVNATNKNVKFESLDESIATVDENGVVTGVNEGNTTIILTTEEGGFKAECTVHVEAIGVESIDRISDKTIKLDLNKTFQLEVNVLPTDATDKTLRWSTNNENIVTVNNSGLITARGSGYGIVTATASNGVSVDFYIEVKSPVAAIKLNYTNVTIYTGKSIVLQACVLPANASNKTIKWFSANESIATVNQAGLIVGKIIGTTYVSAVSADGKVIATCTVCVVKEPVTKPAKVKLKSVKKSGKKAVVKWKKISDAAGYVIYMKTGSGKYKKIKTIKSAKTIKYTRKLKSGKTYRFKIRAYKLDEGDKVFGRYSRVKRIKIK